MNERDLSLYDRVHQSAHAILERCAQKPVAGVVLGTGLGAGLVSELESPVTVSYETIPHFAQPKVESHTGNLVFGEIGGKPVVLMEGRCHLYEGYTLDEVTLPIRVMRALGVETVFLSNAAGGLRPTDRRGDLMLIDDHINLMGDNPLIGHNDERLGPRFPDMCRPYDPELLTIAEDLALEEGIRVQRGVYAALTGPCLETRAEYRMLRMIGADAVGMSTVPEVIVGVHAGLKIFGISCITDLCLPDALEPVRLEEILEVAGGAEPKITLLIRRLIETAI